MNFTTSVLRGFKKDLKAARKTQSPRGVVPVTIVVTIVLVLMSYATGRQDALRPIAVCLLALYGTVVVKWPARGNAWFWVTMAVLTALHVPLIAYMTQMLANYKGASIFIIGPGALIDVLVMLVILNVVEVLVKRWRPRDQPAKSIRRRQAQ